ncbi:MAG: hypothetical protein H3C62_00855 [Gemmatimonadaceae bacterium]|nr:hypothetical protein [Gemmatimonadaceae bacterium]
MTGWLRRVRGTIGMGLTWAVGWALAGILIGVSSLLLPFLPWDRFFNIFDAPLPALAVPGFVGGLIFSAVLGIAGRRRRFDQLSLPKFALWGAVGGLLLALVPGGMVLVGLATIGKEGAGVVALTAVTAPFLMALSSASATVSLLLARKAQGTAVPVGVEIPAEVGLTDDEKHRLIGESVPTIRAPKREGEQIRRD